MSWTPPPLSNPLAQAEITGNHEEFKTRVWKPYLALQCIAHKLALSQHIPNPKQCLCWIISWALEVCLLGVLVASTLLTSRWRPAHKPGHASPRCICQKLAYSHVCFFCEKYKWIPLFVNKQWNIGQPCISLFLPAWNWFSHSCPCFWFPTSCTELLLRWPPRICSS